MALLHLWKNRIARGLVAAVVLAGTLPSAVHAEVGELRLARQYGISHLQMALMDQLKLIEKQAAIAGRPDLKVRWSRFSDGPGMNDALLSGNLDIANGGLTALLVLYDKSRGAFTGLAPLSSMPAVLMMRKDTIKTVRDLTDDDRIAVVSGVSMQAIILRMFAAQAFGLDKANSLDRLTSVLPHTSAMASLMSGRTELTGHFTAAPFYQQEAAAGLHRTISSYDVLGGPATYSVTWASRKFMNDNPATIKIVLAALEEATRMIHDDPKAAATTYIAAEGTTLGVDAIEAIIRDPENIFTLEPQGIMKFATFMASTGTLKQPPQSWKDVFPLMSTRGGS